MDTETILRKIWDMPDSPDCVLLADEWCQMFKQIAADYKRWHVDLFTPAGLRMLFPSLH